jgi:hypothetical protein
MNIRKTEKADGMNTQTFKLILHYIKVLKSHHLLEGKGKGPILRER